MRLVRLTHSLFVLLALTSGCGDDDAPDRETTAPGGAGASGGSAAGRGGGSGAGAGGKGGMAASGSTSQDGGMAGEAPSGESGSQNGGAAGSGTDPTPVDCSKVASAPAKFEILEGFTSAEDFAFDAIGNYVAVEGSNLVRVSKDGKKELWAPNIGDTAGTAILPDGSVILADVTNGAIQRVYANGASAVVLGGLLYPNGLDVCPDGFVYVAENYAGRVRRVNPDNGEFTIVAMGLDGANGVACTNDPKLLYIGSFEGSGVYKVQIPSPGALGVSSVFARPNGSTLAEPEPACPEEQVGKPCFTTTRNEAGTCQQLSNVIDCVPARPCAGLPEGAACLEGSGKCESGQCIPNGDTPDPCTGKPDGQSCSYLGQPGICEDEYCSPDYCAGHAPGDSCWDGVGACVGPAQGPMECVNLCEQKADGVACTLADHQGKCAQELCVFECTLETLDLFCLDDDNLGYCTKQGNVATCVTGSDPNGPGGIDGLAADACGYVYASEYQNGNLWRISPQGEVENLAKLPSAWIPNIKWGRGVGGFERAIMYVADRNGSRLFGVEVGVPGATEIYDVAVE
jgi:sugar lactone lactonase YvrE